MWGNTPPALLGRWALFTGLLLLLGAWGFRTLVARRAFLPEAARRAGERAVQEAALLGSALLLLGVAARLVFQLLDFLEPGEPVASQLRFLVLELWWGRVWMAQAGLALTAALILPWRLPREGGSGPLLGGILASGLAVTPALSGHAAGAEEWAAAAIVADALHVVGAGLWLGTLAVLVRAGFLAPAPDGVRDAAVRGWVERFHPLALGCVATVVLTGGFAAWIHTESPAALFRTDWGFALAAKILAVGVVVALGWRNAWRLRPRLREAGVPGRVLDSSLLEVLAAQLVLLATAALVALSPVPDDHLLYDDHLFDDDPL